MTAAHSLTTRTSNGGLPATIARSVRCAIYTRKSTTEGLDSEFSSLDAQREAAEHYVQSHAPSGWVLVPTRYDDGGFSGGNLERPALARLLDDLEHGKIDVIVTYKVDRLSRSLLDFARLMERFEKHHVSFVSITQHFDTSTSMGRLVLNILLSFAQFEREMIAERTRDKIVASRRRGKWTGGPIPLGYRVVDKRLVPSEPEGETVLRIFRLYDEGKSTSAIAWLLQREAKEAGVKLTVPWTKHRISRILKNPLYVGLMQAGKELCPGQHQPIIPRDLFDRVGKRLESRRTVTERHSNPDYVLRGLLRCGDCGHAIVPASTKKGSREYRYYRCSIRDDYGNASCKTPQMPAPAFEEFIGAQVRGLTEQNGLAESLRKTVEARTKAIRAELESIPTAIAGRSAKASELASALSTVTGPARHVLETELRSVGEAVLELEERLSTLGRELRVLEEQRAPELAWLEPVLALVETEDAVLTTPDRRRLFQSLFEEIIVSSAGERVELRLKDWVPAKSPTGEGPSR
jgi:site-specific DNA recombinase